MFLRRLRTEESFVKWGQESRLKVIVEVNILVESSSRSFLAPENFLSLLFLDSLYKCKHQVHGMLNSLFLKLAVIHMGAVICLVRDRTDDQVRNLV